VDLNYSACSSATFVFGRFPSMCVRPLCGTERFATAAGAELVVRRPERPRLVALTGIRLLLFFSGYRIRPANPCSFRKSIQFAQCCTSRTYATGGTSPRGWPCTMEFNSGLVFDSSW